MLFRFGHGVGPIQQRFDGKAHVFSVEDVTVCPSDLPIQMYGNGRLCGVGLQRVPIHQHRLQLRPERRPVEQWLKQEGCGAVVGLCVGIQREQRGGERVHHNQGLGRSVRFDEHEKQKGWHVGPDREEYEGVTPRVYATGCLVTVCRSLPRHLYVRRRTLYRQVHALCASFAGGLCGSPNRKDLRMSAAVGADSGCDSPGFRM